MSGYGLIALLLVLEVLAIAMFMSVFDPPYGVFEALISR